MNQVLIRDVAIPMRSPMAEQTPNAFHSMNSLNLFIPAIYRKLLPIIMQTATFLIMVWLTFAAIFKLKTRFVHGI
jgi:hypothetical protein